jgi:hypothetical protein
VAQTVHYTVLKDDPSDINKVTIHLDPFLADIWGTNVSMSYGARVETQLGTTGALTFELHKAFVDQYSGKYSLDNPLHKLLYFEAGGEYHLTDKTKESAVKIVLSSSTSGNTTYSKYIMVPAKVRTAKTFRAGFSMINSAYKIQDSKTSVNPATGFSYYNFKGTAGNEEYIFDDPYQSNKGKMNMILLHSGFSVKKITNLVAAVYNRSGKKKK